MTEIVSRDTRVRWSHWHALELHGDVDIEACLFAPTGARGNVAQTPRRPLGSTASAQSLRVGVGLALVWAMVAIALA